MKNRLILKRAKEFLYDIRTLILAIVLWLIPWIILKYGVKIASYPSIPDFVVTMYMILVMVGIILFISVEKGRFSQFIESLKRIWPVLLVLPPLATANLFYGGVSFTFKSFIVPPLLITHFVSGSDSSVSPPPERTIVHSASPLDFVGLENPLTEEDPINLPADNEYIRYGEILYQNNCKWCHGKDADGKGEFHEGFIPKPANFKDTGTIAQLKQSYVLWRITEGGQEEPFLSAMPRWHEDIDDDEKWAIILYEYHHAGVSPRKAEK